MPLLSDHGLHHIPIVNAEQWLLERITQPDLIAALYVGGSRPEGAMPVVPSII
ncbi:MAG TPA: hypothetical protein VMV78_02920 [Thiobacillus sp.]|nr:hypothetical protein [Thiobacillus sp.]